MKQLHLRGTVLRDKAIDRVEAGAPDFVTEVTTIISLFAIGDQFTTDDIWRLCNDRPREPRAMGAAMRHACKLGLCQPLKEWRLSTRPACHRRPLRVWVRE